MDRVVLVQLRKWFERCWAILECTEGLVKETIHLDIRCVTLRPLSVERLVPLHGRLDVSNRVISVMKREAIVC